MPDPARGDAIVADGRSGDPRAERQPGTQVRESMGRLLDIGRIEPERRYTRVDGRRLHYLELGRGPALVLVHGAGGGAANWYRLLGPLAARFRVLAPDLPGYGLSDPIPLTAPLGRHAAGALHKWLERVGVEPFHLLGTSFGGLLALRLAQRAPSMVRRLVLLDSAGLGRGLPWPLRAAALPGVTRLFMQRPSRSAIAWWFRNYITSDRSRMSDAEQSALIDYLWHSDAARDPAWMARALRLFGSLAGQREVLSGAELADIDAETLVLWGEADRTFPVSHGRRAADAIPRARLEALPSAGHSANWERPRALLELLLPFLPNPNSS